MLAPLGPVIMAVIQMPEVDIGGVSIHHGGGKRKREREVQLSDKGDADERNTLNQRTWDVQKRL